MIVRILGILDVSAGIFFWIFGLFGLIPEKLILFLGTLLLIKGIIFIVGFSTASILDIVSSTIIIISTSIKIPEVGIIIVSLYLIQKGILSIITS